MLHNISLVVPPCLYFTKLQVALRHHYWASHLFPLFAGYTEEHLVSNYAIHFLFEASLLEVSGCAIFSFIFLYKKNPVYFCGIHSVLGRALIFNFKWSPRMQIQNI